MKKADPENVEEIVQRARLGDAEAFAVLYESYFTPLYRYIYFRISDKVYVDDLTQEVFLKAYSSFSRYVSSGGSPLAYFYTIARNSIIDHHRKKKMIIADDEDVLNVPDGADNAEVQAVKKEDIEVLRKKIAQLPQDQQDAITLRFIDELSTEDIATMLGKSEVAIRQLQSRGLRFLRNMYTQENQYE